MPDSFLLTTANNLEGYIIVEQCGVVFGETVFKSSFLDSLGAGISNMIDSMRFKETEMSGSVSLIENARRYAYKKMIDEAKSRGANAIIAIDSDNTIGGNVMYISLYGTAVKVISEKEKAEFERKKEEEKEKAAREEEARHLRLEKLKDDIANGRAPMGQAFLQEIEGYTSMIDIWKKWNEGSYPQYYPEVDEFITKHKEFERMYGRGGFNNSLRQLKELLSE